MPPNWKAVTVGTSTILGLGANHRRVWIVIYNNGPKAIEWDHSPNLTYGNGGPIQQFQAVMLSDFENDAVHEPVYLVGNASGNSVRIYEGTGTTSIMKTLMQLR